MNILDELLEQSYLVSEENADNTEFKKLYSEVESAIKFVDEYNKPYKLRVTYDVLARILYNVKKWYDEDFNQASDEGLKLKKILNGESQNTE